MMTSLNGGVLSYMVMQASYIQSLKPTRNLFQAVEKKKSLDKHRPQLNLSKDGQTPLSPRSKGVLIIRSVCPELHCVHASSKHSKNV